MTRLNAVLGGLFAASFVLTACQDEGAVSKTFSGDMVLALSWQPGFCETRPRLPECRSQKAGRFDTTHFALHGLWPQPKRESYCGVSSQVKATDKRRRWRDLPGLGLDKDLQQDLWRAMPGARSFLHRHEWVKHGTCYSDDPNVYFRDSLVLMTAVNSSGVQDLFEQHIGRPLTSRAIRRAFDRAFGKGVGKRVRVACKRDGRRQVITEITLGLSGTVTDNPDIGAMARAAPETRSGCPRGIVDPVGFQ